MDKLLKLMAPASSSKTAKANSIDAVVKLLSPCLGKL